MQIVRDIERLPNHLKGCALTIGNFDGVHRGHAKIISRLKEFARQVGGPAVVFSFDPHPVRLLRPEMAPPPLTWTNRKAELLGQLGVDALVAYPTDHLLLSKTPKEFFDLIIVERLKAKAIIEGPNFYFGKDRAGTTDVLKELCRAENISVEIVEPTSQDDQLISSSRIRELIRSGNVSTALQMLTQPYRIRGLVAHGAGRGSKLGFPTANLEGIDVLLPSPGVYAGRVPFEGNDYAAAINVGPNPTFGDKLLKTEVYLLGFENSLYGETLQVDFYKRLRQIRSFDSVDDLKKQLQIDIENTQQTIEEMKSGQA